LELRSETVGKTFAELHDKLNELYDLKGKAEDAESDEDESARALRQKVFDGAMELLSSTGEFSPILTRSDRQGLEEQLARWRQDIKWPAEVLRDWALRIRR
jgi:hypothetical protein